MLLEQLVALCVYGPLIVLVHELGHAFFARLAGYRVLAFGVGFGKPVITIPFQNGAVFYIGRIPLGGGCTAIPMGPTGTRAAWYHAGGFLAQGTLGLVLLTLPAGWFVEHAQAFNLLVILTNALPWRIGGVASDGSRLRDLAKGRPIQLSFLSRRKEFEALLHLCEDTGAELGRSYALLLLAWSDVLAGRAIEAGSRLRDAQPIQHPWLATLYDHIRGEWHRLEGRPLAALHVSRTPRHAVASGARAYAAALMRLVEARALLDLDSPQQAQQALSHLVDSSGWIGRQATALLLLAALDGPTEDLELAAWRVLRQQHKGWLDAADPVHGLWEAAKVLEERGRNQAARGARDAATLLATRVMGNASPHDQATLSARLGAAVGHKPYRYTAP
jgi:hypothetical protein